MKQKIFEWPDILSGITVDDINRLWKIEDIDQRNRARLKLYQRAGIKSDSLFYDEDGELSVMAGDNGLAVRDNN